MMDSSIFESYKSILMPSDAPASILFIINPISGGKTKNDWESAIREYYKPLTSNPEFFMLTGNNDNVSIQHWIEKIKPSKIVAVGGDGTVSLVAREIIGKNIALGILPAGSANGMATELNIPIAANDALHVIEHGTIKNADVIDVNNH